VLRSKPIADEMSRSEKTKAYDRTMSYLAEHLSSLRQEIADLQKMNTHYSNKNEHSSLDKSALEMRSVRLAQIKKELASMLNRPNDPQIWWERLRSSI
jgi:predicted  nucleic acid-binding Zn-ribbon protein